MSNGRTRSQAARERNRDWKSPVEKEREMEYLRKKHGNSTPADALSDGGGE